MKEERVLIAGGGLAGICLAYQLFEKNRSFLLIDKGENHSSSIAAGLINPMVFRRMLKSWKVDEFLPYALSFYTKTGKYAKQQHFHFIPMRRGFAHQQETDLWLSRQDTEEYSSYLNHISLEDKENKSLINNFGTGVVKQSGYVDTTTFISNSYQLFSSIQSYLKSSYEYSEFDLDNTTFRGEKFSKIIFCEGYHSLENPWFKHLPIQATKGQTLTIKSSQLPNNEILNRKCFILPIGNEQYKVGATYEWNDTNLAITEEGLKSLKENINQLIDKDYTVIHQEAGIRPTVKDRRPLLGEHLDYKNTYIFNGLGTKGYLMAPLLSEILYQYMFENGKLDKEIDIKRFD
jgi:glycine oxidase